MRERQPGAESKMASLFICLQKLFFSVDFTIFVKYFVNIGKSCRRSGDADSDKTVNADGYMY
jgi:hypothetical protein